MEAILRLLQLARRTALHFAIDLSIMRFEKMPSLTGTPAKTQ